MFGTPPLPGTPLGLPPGAAGEEVGQGLRGVAVLGAALLDVLVPDEHAASTIPSTSAVTSIALAILSGMTFRLLS
jgi:hypothetical protein